MALRLTMAFSDNPRVQPLKDGTVKPQNIDLECITLEPSTLFQRNLLYDEFDVSEMSISETLLAIERRDGSKWDWSALPVFLSRGHVWPTLYVNTASGITSLADLKGKRIGVPDYDMTAALWFRITLKDLYGIEARDNVWYNGRTRELSHGGALGLDKDGPVGITHHWLTVDQTLDVMLDRGEIDACTAIRRETASPLAIPRSLIAMVVRPSTAIHACASCSRTTAEGWSMSTTRRRAFSCQSQRDCAKPHSQRPSLGGLGAVQRLPAFQRGSLSTRQTFAGGVPVLSRQRFSGAGRRPGGRPVSHRAPCHGEKYRTRYPGLLGARVTP